MVVEPAIRQQAAVDPRMERLDPAVEHLREAGHGGDVGDRQAGVAQRPGRAAGRDELEAAARPARGPSSTRPVLSDTDRRARRGRGTAASARSRSSRTCRPSAATESAPARSRPTARGSRRCSTARIRAWRVSSSSPGRIGTASWATIGPPSRVASTRWTVQPVTVDAVGERVAHRVGARERRQERRMGVEDPVRVRRQDPRADDPHVAGQDDDIGPGGSQRIGQGGIVAARHERRVDPLLRGPVEGRAGAVGERPGRSRRRARRASPPRGAPAGSSRRPTRRRRCGRSRDDLERALRRSARPPTGAGVDHLADDRRATPCSASAAMAAATASGGTTATMPEPAVERRAQLVVVEPAQGAEQAHDRRHRASASGSSRAARPSGSARGTLPGRPPPVMWARPCRSVPAATSASRAARIGPGVDPGRRQQHLAEGRHRLVRARPRARPSVAASPSVRRRRAWYGSARSRSHWAISARTSE